MDTGDSSLTGRRQHNHEGLYSPKGRRHEAAEKALSDHPFLAVNMLF